MSGAPHPKPAPKAKRKPTRARQPGTSLAYKSEKRHLDADEREHVRLAVIHRDGGCVGPEFGTPVTCGSPDPSRPELECHEVKTRGRGGSYLNIHNCLAACQRCHDWVTTHPREAKRLGLVRASWDPEPTERVRPAALEEGNE